MSQKKVEQYKEYLICCVFVGWFGYSIYDSAVHAKNNSGVPAEVVEIDMNAYSDYVNGLSSTFTEE